MPNTGKEQSLDVLLEKVLGGAEPVCVCGEKYAIHQLVEMRAPWSRSGLPESIKRKCGCYGEAKNKENYGK